MMDSRTANNEKTLTFVAKNESNASTVTFANASAFGKIIFNYTKGDSSLEAFKQAGTGVNGKIIIDVSNPLDFSSGAVPCLIPSLSNTNSLGEEIQKTFPQAKVV